MKEVMAVIRMNRINDTKQALSEAGFPSITCRKVYGRGKKKVNFELIEDLMDGLPVEEPAVIEAISENYRLIAKRLLTMIVEDSEVQKIVDIIIETNQTGNMGDGRIFVSHISDVIRIRTDEVGALAL
jgi:nitrogen regulatory protein PII 2